MENINQQIVINDVYVCLNNFSQLLNNKHSYLTKVDYKSWRKFSVAKTLTLNFDSMNKVYVHALQKDGITFTATFAINDKGFGQYLFDNYYNKEVYMDTTTLNVSNTTGTIATNINWNGYATTETVPYEWLNITPVSINYDPKVELVKREENNMFNFDFGPCGDTIRMSMYGLAVKNQAGEWVSYDSDNGEIVNVDVFNIAEGGKWFYKMPVSVDDVAVGDLVIHAKKPCYVVDFNENTLNPIVIDIFSMERKEILLQRSPFGFNFATKVVSLFDGEKPSAKNPFGNMWMLMMLSNNGKMDDMLPLVMMSHCGNENTPPFGSPLMMYLMMKDNKNLDFLPFMLMMNQQKK